MRVYFVQLGSATDLAYSELVASVGASRLLRYGNFVLGVADTQEDTAYLVEALGGVVKGGRLLKTYFAGWQREDIVSLLANEIIKSGYRKFGVSLLGENLVQDYVGLIRAVKDKVEVVSGKRVGYVLPKGDELAINAAQFRHNIEIGRGVEFVIYFGKAEAHVGQVTAVQPVDLWSKFDFGRPDRRIRDGMLPAKVARMMLNIAVGKYKRLVAVGRGLRVLDPFCGSGTVLSEAMRMGYEVVGLDKSHKAVASARRNLSWTKAQLVNFPKSRLCLPEPIDYASLRFEIACGDAAHIAEIFPGYMVDMVVSEPYMGPLFEKAPEMARARNVVRGLQKLYLGFFKSLTMLLARQSVVVFAMPIIHSSEGPEFEVNIVDRLSEFGYTSCEPGVVYSRLGSVVERKIMVFCYGSRQGGTYRERQ